jgi:undecaprenyl phosphate-alpha-L-ara4FN deformylase
MPLLTLKIDVDTYRGTRVGALNLARLLEKHHAGASFLFSLGPDHTGWALRRAFRPGFFQKVARTSVTKHYGWKTLMYGILLPAPDIGAGCASEMRAVRDAGFECGMHCWDHVLWQDNVRARGADWTAKQLHLAFERFHDIFGRPPPTHGAAGWQMNAHAFALLDAYGITYASDGRARLTARGTLADPSAGPYRPSISSRDMSCIQLPTTLPTLDELLGRTIDGETIDETNAAAAILKLTATPRDHVFTLHAELEGQDLAPIFQQLLKGWRAQGYQLASMADYHRKARKQPLPALPVGWGCLPGRSGELIVVTGDSQ